MRATHVYRILLDTHVMGWHELRLQLDAPGVVKLELSEDFEISGMDSGQQRTRTNV